MALIRLHYSTSSMDILKFGHLLFKLLVQRYIERPRHETPLGYPDHQSQLEHTHTVGHLRTVERTVKKGVSVERIARKAV